MIITFQCSRGNLDIYEPYTLLLIISQTRNSFNSASDTLSSARINIMFWWWVHTQTECVTDKPGRTHIFERKLQNVEDPICIVGYSDLKIECSSMRFGRMSLFCFLFMHIPANANKVLFAWHYSANLVTFIKTKLSLL